MTLHQLDALPESGDDGPDDEAIGAAHTAARALVAEVGQTIEELAGEGLDEYADGLRPAYDRANRALARLEYLDQLERLDAGVVA